MMDIRVAIRAQIAAAEEDQRQHQAAAAQNNASALVCAGVIRGAEMLLAQIEMDEAAEMKIDDAPPDAMTPETDAVPTDDTLKKKV